MSGSEGEWHVEAPCKTKHLLPPPLYSGALKDSRKDRYRNEAKHKHLSETMFQEVWDEIDSFFSSSQFPKDGNKIPYIPYLFSKKDWEDIYDVCQWEEVLFSTQ